MIDQKEVEVTGSELDELGIPRKISHRSVGNRMKLKFIHLKELFATRGIVPHCGLVRPRSQRLGAYRFGMSARPSVCPSVIDSFPGCIFVPDSRRDLEIGSYERFWPVDVPFDSFDQVRPLEMAEFAVLPHDTFLKVSYFFLKIGQIILF